MMLRPAWMLTFADMLSILLCFLVLAYALGAVPAVQRENALSSIRQVFRAGEAARVASPAQSPVARGGNYWATWLKARVGQLPALEKSVIAAHGATASLTLEARPLTDADVAALTDLLRRSGAPIAIRAGASVQTAGGQTAVSWAEAAGRAQRLADRLAAAGLGQTPRVVVAGDDPALMVEIGKDEQ